MIWTREEVAARIHEAWDVLRRVPAPRVRGFYSTWPAHIRDMLVESARAAAVMRLSPASPAAIDRMHEVFGWFVALEGRKHLTAALWLTCGAGMGPKRAGMLLGVHRDTARARRDEALDLIATHLARIQRYANAPVSPQELPHSCGHDDGGGGGH